MPVLQKISAILRAKSYALATLLCGMLAAQYAPAQTWSMGFLESAQDPTQRALVNWSAVTHVIDFGVHPVSNGTLTCDFGSELCSSSAFTTARASLISTAHSRGVKVLMCVTDANGAGGFAGAASSGTLSTFVANIMSMVNTNGYDGVDLDWEASSYTTLMPGLVSALRTALGSNRLLAVDAIPGTQTFWGSNYSALDRVNFMTYDQEGNWNPYTWFNAALFSDSGDGVWSLDLMKRRAIAAGIPAGRFNLGIPFYGYTQTGPTGPRQSVAGNPPLTQIRYGSILSTYPSQAASPTVDSVSRTPWFAITGGWVEYDDPSSVTAKVNYVKTNSLGGWILFSLNKDALGQPLAGAVAAAMGGSTPPPTISSFAASPTSIVSGGSSSLAWSATGGSTCSINQGVGSVSCASGTATVHPTATTIYTLTEINSAGTVTRSATVTVTGGGTHCNNNSGDPALIQNALNAAVANSTVAFSGTCQVSNTSTTVPNNGLTVTGTATLAGSGGASSNYNLNLSSNTTLSGLTFDNATLGTVGSSSGTTTGLVITGCHFQNLTSHATAQISFGPVLKNSSVTNNSFSNIWPGGYTSTVTNPTETLGSGNTGINGFNGYDNVSISGNTFDEIYNDGIHLGFNQMLAITNTYPLAHNNVISDNTFTRVHRYPIEVQSTPDGNCQGGCHFIGPQDGMVISGNYAHNPAWPYWNQWYSLVPDHSTNSKWINNAWIYDNTSQACSGFLVDFWEMGSDNLLFQGNVGAALPMSGCTNRQHYNTLASSQTSSTTTLQNNILCGPAVNPNSVGIENSGAAPIVVNQYNYRNASGCPAGGSIATSSIVPAFASANNQNFPSGGSGTWNSSVISNLPIRKVEYFLDGSGTAAVTQQIQDVNTNFANDRKWLYHATISTTGLSSGNHTITAKATDVSGATQNASQAFTIGPSGNTYYVSFSTGSDSNAGTSTSTPWKTIGKVNSHAYNPGDQILFKTDDTWTGTTLTTSSSGATGNPVAYGSYGNGLAPILEGSGSLSAGVNISKDSITVNGLQIQNDSGENVLITGSNASVTNNTLRNGGTYSLYINGGSNILVDGNTYTSTSGFSGPTAKVFFANSTGGVTYTHNSVDLRNAGTGIGPIAMVVDGGSANVIRFNAVYGGGNASQAYSIKPFGSGCIGPATLGGTISDNYAEGISSAHGDGEIIELEGCTTFHQDGIIVQRNILKCYTGATSTSNTADAIGTFWSDHWKISGNVFLGACGYGTEPTTLHVGKATGGQIYNNTFVGGTSVPHGTAGRTVGPEPGLPFSRVPAGHSLCEFGHVTDSVLSTWVHTCGSTLIQAMNTYLIAGTSTSESYTLFPFTQVQAYNIKHDSAQSCITGFGGGDLGINVADPGYLSYTFGTYVPSILLPHGPGQTPTHVSIDNFDDPERGFMCSGTSNWDSGFDQTDSAWNQHMSDFFKYARDHATSIRLDPHLGSMRDWSAFPTIFQYAPSMMREWYYVSALSGYGATNRAQNYNSLYWHQQFANHMPPVFASDPPTRVMHWGTSLDNGDIHTALANYALVRGPNTFFDLIEQVSSLSYGVDPNRWLPTANALGAATSDINVLIVAAGHSVGDGYNLMGRTFVGGRTYANMTGVTQTVTLPAGATNWSGQSITSLTLGDGKGDVVLLPATTSAPTSSTVLPNSKAIRVAESLLTDIQNDIFADYAKGISNEDTSTVSENHNIFDASVANPSVGTVTHGGTSMTSTDPQFLGVTIATANDVKLAGTSPAIGAGATLDAGFASILNPSGTSPPYPALTQSAPWAIGAFGYGPASGAPSINSFYADPSSITSGDSSTLNWSTSDADTVTITDIAGTPSTVSASGTQSVSPTATTIFVLTATNGFGSNSASVTVTVNAAPALPDIKSFTAEQTSIHSGNATTLSWVVDGADTITIDPLIGDFANQTSVVVRPILAQLYTLEACNVVGCVTQTVLISMLDVPGPSAENIRFHQIRSADRMSAAQSTQFQMFRGWPVPHQNWTALYTEAGDVFSSQPRGDSQVVQMADSVINYTEGHVPVFNSTGALKDSGFGPGGNDSQGCNTWYQQIPLGTEDGTNTSFALDYMPSSPNVILMLNGVVQNPYAEFALSAGTVEFATAPKGTDKMVIWYFACTGSPGPPPPVPQPPPTPPPTPPPPSCPSIVITPLRACGTPHLFWRIFCHETFSTTATEVELHSTAGGSDVTSGGTAIAGVPFPGYNYDNSNKPSNAFDGNFSTWWNETGTDTWLGYHFASPINIVEYAWTVRGDVTPGFQAPLSMTLDWSDDGFAWTSLTSVEVPSSPDPCSWHLGETKTFTVCAP